MNRASLQFSSSSNQPLNSSDSHPPSSDRTVPSVNSVADSSNCEAPSCLPGKTIDQRGCVASVARYGDESDSDCFDTPSQLPSVIQQEFEPQADDDGPWQMVTRRRPRHKRQELSDAVPTGKSDARVTNGVRAKEASAGQLAENRSADNRVTGQTQRLQKYRQDCVSLCSSTLGPYWPLCIESFARLAEVDRVSFDTSLMKYRQPRQIDLTNGGFPRFHRMMTKGPQAIRRVEDLAFLAGPFRVLMFEAALSPDAVFLSLLFEFKVPGFLRMLSERFVFGLAAINRSRKELCMAITGLLTDISQKDNHWLDRLGWQELTMRHRCNLYSFVTFIVKKRDNNDVILSLQRQVSRPFLETFFYVSVRKLHHKISDPRGVLRDLRAVVRATFHWLGNQFIVTAQTEKQRDQTLLYASICEALLEVMGSLELNSGSLLFSLWQTVALWSFNLRLNLSKHLGYDRSIALLDGLLHHIHRWPELERFANDLRLILLGSVLMKCEDLSLRRDIVLSCQVWEQYKSKLESLLVRCDQFMGNYQSAFIVDDSVHARRKEEVRLNLMLRKSAFYRLDCVIRKSSRQRIQDNLQMCCKAFAKGWALSQPHLEIGTLELAKWYFLAGEHDAGVSSLMDVPFNCGNLWLKKAELLASQGVYQAAVEEYRRIRAQTTDQSVRDHIDSRIAMAQLHWYLAEKNTDQLISAYRLSVDLLGRCDVCDRGRFQGGLCHIVIAMKASGLEFKDFVGETAVLGYLVKDGCGIKSWHHFGVLLHVRHKLGLTDAHTVDALTEGLAGKHSFPLIVSTS